MMKFNGGELNETMKQNSSMLNNNSSNGLRPSGQVFICPLCQYEVVKSEFGDHIVRLHVGQGRCTQFWSCGSCDFKGPDVNSITEHCLALKHNAEFIKRDSWDQFFIRRLSEIQVEMAAPIPTAAVPSIGGIEPLSSSPPSEPKESNSNQPQGIEIDNNNPAIDAAAVDKPNPPSSAADDHPIADSVENDEPPEADPTELETEPVDASVPEPTTSAETTAVEETTLVVSKQEAIDVSEVINAVRESPAKESPPKSAHQLASSGSNENIKTSPGESPAVDSSIPSFKKRKLMAMNLQHPSPAVNQEGAEGSGSQDGSTDSSESKAGRLVIEEKSESEDEEPESDDDGDDEDDENDEDEDEDEDDEEEGEDRVGERCEVRLRGEDDEDDEEIDEDDEEDDDEDGEDDEDEDDDDDEENETHPKLAHQPTAQSPSKKHNGNKKDNDGSPAQQQEQQEQQRLNDHQTSVSIDSTLEVAVAMADVIGTAVTVKKTSSQSSTTNSDRTRTILPKEELMSVFNKNPFPDKDQVAMLEEKLGVTKTQIRQWFGDQRRKHNLTGTNHHPKTASPAVNKEDGRDKSPKDILMKEFMADPSMPKARCQAIAEQTGLKEQYIINWFCRQRFIMKQAKQEPLDPANTTVVNDAASSIMDEHQGGQLSSETTMETTNGGGEVMMDDTTSSSAAANAADKQSSSANPRKRHTKKTPAQVDILEKSFAKNSKLAAEESGRIAEATGMDLDTIYNWFRRKRSSQRNAALLGGGSVKDHQQRPSTTRPTNNEDNESSSNGHGQNWLDGNKSTDHQMNADQSALLERCFEQNPTPSNYSVSQIHSRTGLGENQISDWFSKKRLEKSTLIAREDN